MEGCGPWDFAWRAEEAVPSSTWSAAQIQFRCFWLYNAVNSRKCSVCLVGNQLKALPDMCKANE
jgi:hypothetical protein